MHKKDAYKKDVGSSPSAAAAEAVLAGGAMSAAMKACAAQNPEVITGHLEAQAARCTAIRGDSGHRGGGQSMLWGPSRRQFEAGGARLER